MVRGSGWGTEGGSNAGWMFEEARKGSERGGRGGRNYARELYREDNRPQWMKQCRVARQGPEGLKVVNRILVLFLVLFMGEDSFEGSSRSWGPAITRDRTKQSLKMI
eukprot:765306-Hanusia_phi.AAC.2